MKEEQKDTSRDYRNEAEQAHVININIIITGLLVIFSIAKQYNRLLCSQS